MFKYKAVQNWFKVDNFFEAKFALGAGDANCPEPLLNYIIIEFSKLQQAYQSLAEEEIWA